ncbi:D-3-phosphoglycerate dehydrogenase [plant metagenome]|uniref:D-3-phosphoglycerate dehydrogenase n=1 Tax=plant metagenome TaxID=1297885 RepID=A0A484V5X5_9ZZZZ
MHVLFAAEGYDTERWVGEFAKALPGIQVTAWQPGDAPRGADAAIVWQPPAEFFRTEPGLRGVFNLGAGVDALLASGTLPASATLVRLEDAGMSVQMAEYALYAILRAARDFDVYDAAQRDGRWHKTPPIRRAQWPVGVLGLGVVGRRVAQALAAFDFPVAGWSRSGGEVPGVEVHAGIDALPGFLARTRVLVNVLPLTDETRDILNRDTLGRLLPGSHLINVGRGQHLVEEDLLHALENGPLAGATLDVFRTEPLPEGHPFWAHPKIHVTPHVAARTLRAETIAQIAEKIRVFAAGGTPSGVVARDRGY